MDLVLRNVLLVDGDAVVIADIGITDGRIAAVEPGLNADAEEMDLEGCFAVAGFVELHIHLDKACILDRCKADEGTLDEAIREVSKAKKRLRWVQVPPGHRSSRKQPEQSWR